MADNRMQLNHIDEHEYQQYQTTATSQTDDYSSQYDTNSVDPAFLMLGEYPNTSMPNVTNDFDLENEQAIYTDVQQVQPGESEVGEADYTSWQTNPHLSQGYDPVAQFQERVKTPIRPGYLPRSASTYQPMNSEPDWKENPTAAWSSLPAKPVAAQMPDAAYLKGLHYSVTPGSSSRTDDWKENPSAAWDSLPAKPVGGQISDAAYLKGLQYSCPPGSSTRTGDSSPQGNGSSWSGTTQSPGNMPSEGYTEYGGR